MTFQPNREFVDQKARNRLSELEECFRIHNIRIISLETHIRQHSETVKEIENSKQQISSLNTAIIVLKKENSNRVREHQTLSSNVEFVAKCQEELKEFKKTNDSTTSFTFTFTRFN
jgi:hypothetical protein